MAASYGRRGEACVLTIWGPTSESELIAIIDEAVPAASRGLALGAMSECMGICKTVRKYEKATVSTAVMAGQIASPAAIVAFRSKTCEGRVKEARDKGLFTTRTRPPAR